MPRTRIAAALLLAASAASAQPPTAATALDGWEVARGGASAFAIAADGVRADGQGWVRTRSAFLDFDLDLEFRLLDAKAEGGIAVRALPFLPDGWPQAGYRIELRAQARGRRPNGAVTSYSKQQVEPTGEASAPAGAGVTDLPVGEWQRLQVRMQGQHLAVRMNGWHVQDVLVIGPLAGYIGLEARGGTVEYRNVRITQLASGTSCDPAAPRAGLGPPRPGVRGEPTSKLRDVKPQYPPGAMKRRVQGTVVLGAGLAADGSIRTLCVLKPLDPELDVMALHTVRQWLFSPSPSGNDGRYVTTELTFRLR